MINFCKEGADVGVPSGLYITHSRFRLCLSSLKCWSRSDVRPQASLDGGARRVDSASKLHFEKSAAKHARPGTEQREQLREERVQEKMRQKSTSSKDLAIKDHLFSFVLRSLPSSCPPLFPLCRRSLQDAAQARGHDLQGESSDQARPCSFRADNAASFVGYSRPPTVVCRCTSASSKG